jgi:hypothetical protein
VNINAEKDWAFKCACTENHLPVAQWLHGLGVISIQQLNSSYQSFYVGGELKLWLKSLVRTNTV